MQLFMNAPVQSASGKTFSRKKAVSTRTINGQTYSYQWPEDYDYPVVFNRAKQNLLLRMAQQEANKIYANPEELARCKREFEKDHGKYKSLRGYIFGLCHARVAPQITDEQIHAEMQRQINLNKQK